MKKRTSSGASLSVRWAKTDLITRLKDFGNPKKIETVKKEDAPQTLPEAFTGKAPIYTGKYACTYCPDTKTLHTYHLTTQQENSIELSGAPDEYLSLQATGENEVALFFTDATQLHIKLENQTVRKQGGKAAPPYFTHMSYHKGTPELTAFIQDRTCYVYRGDPNEANSVKIEHTANITGIERLSDAHIAIYDGSNAISIYEVHLTKEKHLFTLTHSKTIKGCLSIQTDDGPVFITYGNCLRFWDKDGTYITHYNVKGWTSSYLDSIENVHYTPSTKELTAIGIKDGETTILTWDLKRPRPETGPEIIASIASNVPSALAGFIFDLVMGDT